jgi:hypothetical protein
MITPLPYPSPSRGEGVNQNFSGATLMRGGKRVRHFFVLAVLCASAAVADEDLQGAVKLPGGNFILPVRPPASNALPVNPAGPTDVITQRNNNLRTGTTFQRGLNQAAVSGGRFGLVHKFDVDGAVLAQPLFMESVRFPNGRRSAIFIATATNWVYGFDANPPFAKLWEHQLAAPFRVDDPWNENNPNPERQSCLAQTASTEQDDHSQHQFVTIGIEATPAIVPVHNRMVVSYRRAEGARGGTQWIAALDIRTGHFAKGPDGSDLNRRVTDNPIWNNLHRNRTSLLIEQGVVYVGYSARCESFAPGFDKSYQGWIYAFDVGTLAFAGRYRTTENPVGPVPQEPSDDPVDGGGIWQASTGLASDGKGNIFFSTGNARKSPRIPDAAGKNLSSSVIRLQVQRDETNSPRHRVTVAMTAADWFTPYRKIWQDKIDLDFGSAGVVLVPNTRYLTMAGKEGMLYVLDRNNLGRFDDLTEFHLADVFCKAKTAGDPGMQDDPERDRVVQKIQVGENQYCKSQKNSLFCSGDALAECPKYPDGPASGVSMDDWISWPHVHGTPVFGAFLEGRAFLYIWPEKDSLKSYQWWGGGLEATPTVATRLPSQEHKVFAPPYLRRVPIAVGMPGGMLSLTIDPSKRESGVLFASVQRCRMRDTDTEFHECDPQWCARAVDNCREQRYGMLRAFDPITLAELWNNQTDPRDGERNYWFAKFVPPTIANGRVYLATQSKKVLVYGRR